MKTRLSYCMMLMIIFILVGCGSTQETQTEVATDDVKTEAENEVLKVIYPNVNGEGEHAFGYAVLKLALEKSGVEYELTLRRENINNERIRFILSEGLVSITDFGTSPEFEDLFRPIPYPIDLGLNGWRIMVIRDSDRESFGAIETIDQLKAFRGGQGVGWPDTEILRHAGLEIIESPDLETLFFRLMDSQFDYLPLGANEVHSLLDLYVPDGESVV